jgi:hypothetical protein
MNGVNNMKKWISGLVLALGLCSFANVQADSCNPCYDPCYNPCYDTCFDACGPLCTGSFSVHLKGGVVPSNFSDRGRIWITDPSLATPVYSLGRVPKFSRLFDTPWSIGLELGYAVSDHAQVFLEGSWYHAEGKRLHSDTLFGNFDSRVKHKNYEAWGGYLGARYFFGNWFANLSPFVGFKAGFVRTRRVSSTFEFSETFLTRSRFFDGHTGPSVGAQVGLNYNFCSNWNAVLTLEAVATHAFRGNGNIDLPDVGLAGAPTNLSIGDVGYLISYPVTLGVRYDF